MGPETAIPTRGVFHAMFSSLAQDVGTPVSFETPFPRGPLHCGQFSACAMPNRKLLKTNDNFKARIGYLPKNLNAEMSDEPFYGTSLNEEPIGC
jgi:hypothetical protein